MRIIDPNDIGIVSTTVSESLHSEWASGTSYSAGDRVYVTLESDGTTERTPHEIYEAAQSTTADYPPDNPAQWLFVAPTNRWAFLAPLSAERTVVSGGWSATVTAIGDRVALLDMRADTVDVITRDSSGTQLDSITVDGRFDAVDNWKDYFFADIGFTRNAIVEVDAATAEVDITVNQNADAALGNMAVGDNIDIGTTERGLRLGIQDFSIKDRNDFGEETLVKRESSEQLEGDAIVTFSDDLVGLLAGLRARPVVWDFRNDTALQEAVVFGFYRDFDLTRNAAFPTVSFDVRSLT